MAQSIEGRDRDKEKQITAADDSSPGAYDPIMVASVPEGLELETVMPDSGGSLVPPATREALSVLQTNDIMAEITELEWRDDDQTVVMYANDVDSSLVRESHVPGKTKGRVCTGSSFKD